MHINKLKNSVSYQYTHDKQVPLLPVYINLGRSNFIFSTIYLNSSTDFIFNWKSLSRDQPTEQAKYMTYVRDVRVVINSFKYYYYFI